MSHAWLQSDRYISTKVYTVNCHTVKICTKYINYESSSISQTSNCVCFSFRLKKVHFKDKIDPFLALIFNFLVWTLQYAVSSMKSTLKSRLMKMCENAQLMKIAVLAR